MKTLYISDLDGTLLNERSQISNNSIKILNELMKNGVNFTYSTARTSASAPILTRKLNITLPVILMNGVAVYDSIKKEYINVEAIEKPAVKAVIELLDEHNIDCFLFSIEKNTLNTFYKKLSTEHMQAFHDERVAKFNKKFIQRDDLSEIDNSVYFSIFNKKACLKELYKALKMVNGIEVVFYRDTYDSELYYLEIASKKATKGKAAEYFREKLGFDRLIGFGDNSNDISLLKACDEFYAVKNAKPKLLELATGIIPENIYDSVPNKIRELKEREK